MGSHKDHVRWEINTIHQALAEDLRYTSPETSPSHIYPKRLMSFSEIFPSKGVSFTHPCSQYGYTRVYQRSQVNCERPRSVGEDVLPTPGGCRPLSSSFADARHYLGIVTPRIDFCTRGESCVLPDWLRFLEDPDRSLHRRTLELIWEEQRLLLAFCSG